ncbi:hypothetical protein A7D23_01075 [Dehalobacter sp. TeCB1]|nr:hypothetical protein A7D23_01075 [Dehalobacter sp. TeCB1]
MNKAKIESRISDIISKFEKDYMGRGSKDIKTKIIQNHILIFIDGFLSKSEQQLAYDIKGISLIKETGTELFEKTREDLEALIKGIVDINIVSTHSDVSTKTGEKVIVLTVDCDLESRLI